MIKIKTLATLLSIVFLFACASSDIFPLIEDNIATPVALSVDEANQKLYVVNSNGRILYNPNEGSFQVYDITNPVKPDLLSTLQTASFSGQMYQDFTNSKIYLTNRYSDEDSKIDRLYVLSLDAEGKDPEIESEIETALNPFSIECCYPANTFWFSSDDLIQSYDMDLEKVGDISLIAELSNGIELTEVQTFDIALFGGQAYVSRFNGGILIVNLDKEEYAVDYFINDVGYPRGIYHDGTYLYVTTTEQVGDTWTPRLLVLDVSSLTPRTDNKTAKVIDKEEDKILVKAVQVAEDPQNVIVFDDAIWVACEGDDKVVVLNADTYKKLKDIDIAEDPFSMVGYTAPDSNKYMFVGALDGNTITIIDSATKKILATYSR